MAVNGIPIDNMHHEDIIKQIKDSGYVVTLTIGAPQDIADDAANATAIHPPQDVVNPAASSAMQPPQQKPPPPQQMQYLDPTQPMQQPPRSVAPVNGNADAVPYQSQQYPASKPHPIAQTDEAGNAYLTIDLHRGNRGFGFSIRGGQVLNI